VTRRTRGRGASAVQNLQRGHRQRPAHLRPRDAGLLLFGIRDSSASAGRRDSDRHRLITECESRSARVALTPLNRRAGTCSIRSNSLGCISGLLVRPHWRAVHFPWRNKILPALRTAQSLRIQSHLLSGSEDRIAVRAFDIHRRSHCFNVVLATTGHLNQLSYFQ